MMPAAATEVRTAHDVSIRAAVLADLGGCSSAGSGYANCINVLVNAALIACTLNRSFGVVVADVKGGADINGDFLVPPPGVVRLATPPATAVFTLDFVKERAAEHARALLCTDLAATTQPILVKNANTWVAHILHNNRALPNPVQARARRLFRAGRNTVGELCSQLWPHLRLPRPEIACLPPARLPPIATPSRRYASASTLPAFTLVVHARHQFSHQQAKWARQPWSGTQGVSTRVPLASPFLRPMP